MGQAEKKEKEIIKQRTRRNKILRLIGKQKKRVDENKQYALKYGAVS